MAWISVITNAGAALLASYAQGGHTLNVTDASVASGTMEEANLRIATALTTEKDSASIVRKSTTSNATKFKIQVGAAEASVGAYTAHQIGLWANLDGGTRTLLALAQDATGGVGVPLKSVSPNFAFALYITVAVGNTGTISVTVDGGAFVTGATLEEAIGEAVDALEDEIDLKADAADVYTKTDMDTALGGKKGTQTAVTDPTASGSGLTFIASISQDAQGVINPTKKTVQDGTTSQKGVVQLEDSHTSTATDKAATPKNVKEAYDLANGKAAPSSDLSLTALAANWSNAEPSTQTISATGVTASNNILVGAGTLTAEQQEAMVAAQIMCTAQASGTITLTAFGEVPEINLPIVVFILG